MEIGGIDIFGMEIGGMEIGGIEIGGMEIGGTEIGGMEIFGTEANAAATSSGVNTRVVQTPLVQLVMVPVDPEILMELLVVVVPSLELVELLLEFDEADELDEPDELEMDTFVGVFLAFDETFAVAEEAMLAVVMAKSGVMISVVASARRIRVRRGETELRVKFTVGSFRTEWFLHPATRVKQGNP